MPVELSSIRHPISSPSSSSSSSQSEGMRLADASTSRSGSTSYGRQITTTNSNNNKRIASEAFSQEELLDTEESSQQPQFLHFRIQDFANLSHSKGFFVETNSIELGGRSWYLRVYPRGHESSRSDQVLVSCFLLFDEINPNSNTRFIDDNKSKNEEFEFTFSIKDWKMIPKRCGLRSDAKYGYGFMGHRRRRLLAKGLDENGTLVIGVGLRFFPASPSIRVWYPRSKRHRNNNADDKNQSLFSDLFRSTEFSDVSFLVGTTTFRAHKCILAVRSRMLLELALPDGEDTSGSDDHPIPILGIDQQVFGVFLEYVYTSNERTVLDFLSNGDDNACMAAARSLLKVADQFACIDLKLWLESILVDRFLTPTTCADLLVLADAFSCALLKEQAMELYANHPMDVIAESSSIADPTSSTTSDWTRLTESPKLLSELLLYTARKSSRRTNKNKKARKKNSDGAQQKQERNDSDEWTVGTLRDRLEEAGLELDGSRESLIRRWKTHVQRS